MSFDPTRGAPLAIHRGEEAFYALCADPARRRVYAGGAERAVLAFELPEKLEPPPPVEGEKKKDSETPLLKLDPKFRGARHRNYVSALAWLPGAAPRIVSGSYDRSLVWWQAESGEPLAQVEAHAGWVRQVVAFPDGSRLASAGDDMLVKLWDADGGRLITTFAGHARQTPQGYTTALYALAVHPEGTFLASGDRHGEVRIWDVQAAALAARFECPALYTFDPIKRSRALGGIRSLAFSPDGASLAVSGIGPVTNVDGFVGPARLEVWDWRKPERKFAAQADKHQAVLNQVLYHPAGDWIVGVGGGDSGGLVAYTPAQPAPAAEKEPPPAEKQKPTEKQDSTEKQAPAEKQKSAADATIPLERLKASGHLQRAAWDAAGTALYVAGHGSIEVWRFA